MIFQILYILFCLGLAKYNAYRIKVKNLVIDHPANGIIHLLCWSLIFSLRQDYILLVTLPFAGRVFFDSALDRFRGLSLDYVSADPESWIDKAEKFVFRDNGILPKIIYVFFLLLMDTLLILKGYWLS